MRVDQTVCDDLGTLQSGEMHEANDGRGASPVSSSQTVDEDVPAVLDLILDIFEDWTNEGDQLLLKCLLFRKKNWNWNTIITREFPANFLHQAILNL